MARRSGGRRLQHRRIGERHIGRQIRLLLRRKADGAAARTRALPAVDERIEHDIQEFVHQLERALLGASRRADGLGTLTARERDVLALMAEGRSNAAIAGILVVSEKSVEKHIGNIFSKLGLAPSDADHRRVLAVLRYLES